MKLISWNVNGLRACIQKGFLDQFHKLDADFFCLQETKLQEGQIQLELPGYEQYWCYAEKKGYSGTAIFTKHTPLSVSYGIGVPELDTEGRVITLEYPEFYLVNCYTPNAQRGLARLDHRMKWDEAYRSYIASLDARKPTILCGDLNVAHQEIDLKNPSSNRGNAGFSDQERNSFTKTLSLGFTDSFRYLNPTATGAYSWWSYMYHARENNAGWRIDYFLVSDRIREKIYRTPIYSEILGSDHCPVGLEIDLSCNGSIWMEEKKGQPKLVLPPKKPSKPIITGILAVFAITVLLGLGSFAVRLLPVSSSEYLSLHAYTTPLKQQGIIAPNLNLYTGKLQDGNILWNLYSQYSSIAPPEHIGEANFWLRLDMTPKAKAEYNSSWVLDASSEPELRIGQIWQTGAVYDLVVFPYYLGEDPGDISGWFIYGRLPGEVRLDITLDTGSRRIKTTHIATPLDTAPNIHEAELLDTEDLVQRIVTDLSIQSQLNLETYQHAVANNGFLTELENRTDAVSYLILWFQDGTDQEKQAAYILLSQDIYQARMRNYQKETYSELAHFFLTLDETESRKLSTENLLDYLLEQDLMTEIHKDTLNPFERLKERFPSFAVFVEREDMVEVLMKEQRTDSRSLVILNYLLYETYFYRVAYSWMSAEQEADYLLGSYASYNLPYAPVSYHFPLPLETKTTEELVRMLVLDSGLGKMLLNASSENVRDLIYTKSSTDPLSFSDILSRDDLIDTIFQMADPDAEMTTDEEKQYLKAFLRLSTIQSRMTAEQKATYEESYRHFVKYGLTCGVHPASR